MKIIMSGAGGLVGKALTARLTAKGHCVVPLIRSAPGAGGTGIFWDPDRGMIGRAELEGCDAVIHLAGENIASRRWTIEQKRRIRDSRAKGTEFLSRTLAELHHPPRVLLSASAVGYYGDRGQESLTESSGPGKGFLPEVCREWEASTRAASDKGIRVVHMRFGMVLSRKGGALARMLLPFRLGVGGRIGDGSQFMNWITLGDAAGIVEHLLSEEISGPVNVVAPLPVTNAGFARILGKVLHRPSLFPLPAFAARLALGEMADELLLASARVFPQRLLETGYPFEHPELEGALRAVLFE